MGNMLENIFVIFVSILCFYLENSRKCDIMIYYYECFDEFY